MTHTTDTNVSGHSARVATYVPNGVPRIMNANAYDPRADDARLSAISSEIANADDPDAVRAQHAAEDTAITSNPARIAYLAENATMTETAAPATVTETAAPATETVPTAEYKLKVAETLTIPAGLSDDDAALYALTVALSKRLNGRAVDAGRAATAAFANILTPETREPSIAALIDAGIIDIDAIRQKSANAAGVAYQAEYDRLTAMLEPIVKRAFPAISKTITVEVPASKTPRAAAHNGADGDTVSDASGIRYRKSKVSFDAFAQMSAPNGQPCGACRFCEIAESVTETKSLAAYRMNVSKAIQAVTTDALDTHAPCLFAAQRAESTDAAREKHANVTVQTYKRID